MGNDAIKKILKLAFLLGILAAIQTSAFAQSRSEDGPADYKGFSRGYCTYYAAREFDKAAPDPGQNWRGNANAWVSNASKKGWRTSSQPTDAQVNALIVWNDGGFGHVGVVENVNGTTIQVSEMNWGKIVDKENAVTTNFNKVSSVTLKTSNLDRGTSFRFAGYIFPDRGNGQSTKAQTRFVVHLRGNETWLDTGIQVRRGQAVDILASGQVMWDANQKDSVVGPEGVWYSPYQNGVTNPEDFPMPQARIACLLMKIGSGMYTIGRGLSVIVKEDSTLKFMINDRYNGLSDNTGDLSITINVLP